MECFVALPNSTVKIVEMSLKGKGQECMDKVKINDPVSDRTFTFRTHLSLKYGFNDEFQMFT